MYFIFQQHQFWGSYHFWLARLKYELKIISRLICGRLTEEYKIQGRLQILYVRIVSGDPNLTVACIIIALKMECD